MKNTKKKITGWQPIKTAPKTGVEILLFTQGRQCVEGYWSTDNKHWAVLLYDDDNEPLTLCNSIAKSRKRNKQFVIEMFEVEPVAWMPLPQPPKSK